MALALALGGGACRFGDFTPDAGLVDAATGLDGAGVADGSGLLDAGATDAAATDGAIDAAVDAAVIDAAVDAAVIDAAVDAAVIDAAVDATPIDAAVDATPIDAGPHPIGPLGPGLSTLVGDSSRGLLDGPRDFSLFSNPVNMLVGPNGNIYVADLENNAIREVTPAGVTTTLVRQPGFQRPFGMAFTPSGDFYVQTDRNSAGISNGALWLVDVDTGVASLERENIGFKRGLASLSDGRLVMADLLVHTVSIYDPVAGSVTLLAGLANTPGFVDGTGNVARFDRPKDVVVTSADVIFLADSNNHRIRRIDLAGVVTTVAGDGTAGTTDGAALSASFDAPSGLALDGDDVLYICEFQSGFIRKMDSGNVSTVAGSTPGFADNSDPLLGQLKYCEGADFASPHLYFSGGNAGVGSELFHRVRRLDTTVE